MNNTTTTAVMQSVAVNSAGVFVAVGYLSGTGYPVSATSTNGSTWTTPAQMNGSTTGVTALSVTVLGAGPFVSVGYLFANSYPIYAVGTFS
jgi:hypothetical protein